MKILVIIPAFNEEACIGPCLDSFIAQSKIPDKLIVVDDGSTDQTAAIVQEKSSGNPWISLVRKTSQPEHRPGAKVVQCFNYGLKQVDSEAFDLIGKFDADLILPENYFEELLSAFRITPDLGLAGGLLYVEENGSWVYESIADKTHVRGPLKLYSKTCFKAIGGLRETIGWDTLDSLLSQFHGFKTTTLKQLKVKHLRSTGGNYRAETQALKGKAFYKMRYGFLLSCIASLKAAVNARRPGLFFGSLRGFLSAFYAKENYAVTLEEGRFIRRLRWQGIRKKLF